MNQQFWKTDELLPCVTSDVNGLLGQDSDLALQEETHLELKDKPNVFF